jgi:hypothetical protein
MQNTEKETLSVGEFARLLNVSNPYAAKLIETSAVAFEVDLRSGDRVVPKGVALGYKAEQDKRSDAALTELAREAQGMGLY